MRNLRFALLAGTLLLILLGSSVAWAGSSTSSATIDWLVFDLGGAPSTAGDLVLQGSVGQVVAGQAASPSYSLDSGYWPGISSPPARRTLFVPMVLR